MAKCKGSKLWMWKIVTEDQLRIGLEEKLEKIPLKWISPRIDEENEKYKEYQLNYDSFLDEISKIEGFSNIKKEIFSFWPSKGPVWDGIAVSEESKTMYLFEAKSYPGEMYSATRAKPESLKDIHAAMKNACEKVFGKDSKYKEEIWERKKEKGEHSYYQFGNRLTFLYNLNEKKENTGISVKLVFLNIVNDNTHIDNKRTSEEAWDTHYRTVFKMMCYGGESNKKLVIPQNVEIIYYNTEKKEFTRRELEKKED